MNGRAGDVAWREWRAEPWRRSRRFPAHEVTTLSSSVAAPANSKRVRVQIATAWRKLTGEGIIEGASGDTYAALAEPAAATHDDVVLLGSPAFAVDEDRVQAGFSLYNRGTEFRSGMITVRLLKDRVKLGQKTIAFSLAGGATQDFFEVFTNTPAPGQISLELVP
jgi:hypothetical protein